MRKIIYALPLFLLLSCSGYFRVVADMGMTEAEFKRKNHAIEVVKMYENRKVYRVVPVGNSVKYVYFENGLLYRMDEGQMFYPVWQPFYPGEMGLQ
ncbi:hypothetical protein KIH41_08255 [Litoribacter ruber]|uniref:hypothetical protein n=1 Tax=Litoribacter ruber TaxID=702568 RepID=UPI001BD98DDE|nr:hypothetical protein [Litoribacter ruber]MBT0811271.1 hypothetical protein [Litoribacter ruber]